MTNALAMTEEFSTAFRLLFDRLAFRMVFDCFSTDFRLLFDWASTVFQLLWLLFDCFSTALPAFRLLFAGLGDAGGPGSHDSGG